jgi:hypothetical protein
MCDDRGGTADRAGKSLPHHPAAGGHEDEEECSEQLREEAAPLLARILEVVQRRDDLVIQMAQCSAGLRLRHDLFSNRCRCPLASRTGSARLVRATSGWVSGALVVEFDESCAIRGGAQGMRLCGAVPSWPPLKSRAGRRACGFLPQDGRAFIPRRRTTPTRQVVGV